MRYELKTIREDLTMAKAKKDEETLRDLLTILPTLKKHQLEAELHKKVKTLRNGRTQKNYVLELSRTLPISEKNLETQYGQVPIVIKGQTFLSDVVISRKVIEKRFKASAPITRKVIGKKGSKTQNSPELDEVDHGGKVKLLKQLKENILVQVRAARKANRPPIEDYSFKEGVKVRKLAEVYLDSGTFSKLADKRVRLHMTKAKVPTSMDNHIGVEIEFACKQDSNTVADKLFEAGVGRHIQIKRDGSILVDDTFPHAIEIAIIAKQTDIFDVIKKIAEVLNNKLNVRIDKSCGLHVHVDMRNRDHVKSFYNLIKMQKYLYSMVPAKRKAQRDDNGYSQMIDSPEWKVTPNHYYGVNSEAFNKYKTLEIRMHCGTSQARKINNWISFILAIVEANKLTDVIPDSIKDMKETLKITDGLIKYIESRLAKFAAQHKKVPNPNWMGNPAPVEVEADNEENEASEVA